MAKLDSPHWNEKLGVCTKHKLPSVPCPACIATKDEDLELVLDRIEREGWAEEILIPKGFEYLLETAI